MATALAQTGGGYLERPRPSGLAGLPELLESTPERGAKAKTAGAIEGVKDALGFRGQGDADDR